MSMSPQYRPQATPLSGPGPEAADGQLNDGLVLETLNLHAGAINTALTRLHALEAQFQGLPMSQPNAPQIVEQRLHQVGAQLQVLAERITSGERRAIYMGNGLVLTQVLNHFMMYLDSNDLSMTPHLIFYHNWEWGTTKVLSELLKPGMTVVDIGANVGYYTLIAAAAVGAKGRVYALEPEPRNFEILKRNIFANRFHERVLPHCCAALNQRQEVLLNRASYLAGCHTLLAPEHQVPMDQPISVEALPLDEIIHEKVDLIKIDAEGAEPFILEGMHEVIAHNPGLKIIMEFNVPMIQKTLEPASFLSRIRELGFTFRMISENGVLENADDGKVLQASLSNLLLERLVTQHRRVAAALSVDAPRVYPSQ